MVLHEYFLPFVCLPFSHAGGCKLTHAGAPSECFHLALAPVLADCCCGYLPLEKRFHPRGQAPGAAPHTAYSFHWPLLSASLFLVPFDSLNREGRDLPMSMLLNILSLWVMAPACGLLWPLLELFFLGSPLSSKSRMPVKFFFFFFWTVLFLFFNSEFVLQLLSSSLLS